MLAGSLGALALFDASSFTGLFVAVANAGVVVPMAAFCPIEDKPPSTGCYNWVCSAGSWVRGTQKANGSPCSDNNTCTTGDKCSNGACVGVKVTGLCCSNGVAKPPGSSCTDNNACNGLEVCQAGACMLGEPLAIDDGNAGTADSCNPATGVSHVPIAAECCTAAGQP